MNPRQLNNAKLRTQFMYTKKPRRLPNVQVLLNNVATTIEQAVRNLSITFQMYKCGLKVKHITTTECFDDRDMFLVELNELKINM